jgi:hypothetical protein
VRIDFKMLKVKVLIIFFGTPVFSARRDRRYKEPNRQINVGMLDPIV